MAIIPMERTVSLDEPIKVEKLTGTLFTAESQAHQFTIHCTRGGDDFPVSGTVTARFKRADGSAVLLAGTSTGGVAAVTLVADCYNQAGAFQLTVFVTENNSTLAIYSAVGIVTSTVDGDLIDGSERIPANIDELVQELERLEPMRGATAATRGASGLVPAPAHGDHVKYLRGDGQWGDIFDILDKVTITTDVPLQTLPGELSAFADEVQVLQALSTVPLVAFKIAFKPSQSTTRALPTATQAITGHDIVQFDSKFSSTFVLFSYYYHLADAMLRPVYGGTIGGDQTGVVTYSESWISVAGSDLTWEMVDTNGVITFEADLTEHGTAAAWSNNTSNRPLCDYYTCIAASNIYMADYEHPMSGTISYDQYFSLDNNKLIVREASCTTAEAFAELIADATFVFMLSNAVDYNIIPDHCYVGGTGLTPTPGASKVSPSPNSYFSSPDGQVAVRYRKDLQAIISGLDSRITALENAST